MPSIQLNKGARRGKTGRTVDMSSNYNSELPWANEGTSGECSPNGFIKLNRGLWTNDLLAEVSAWHLLTVIGLRARWSDRPNRHNLKIGQALIGDSKTYGLTSKKERNARKLLTKLNLVNFKATTRGTIATLISNEVFDLGINSSGINNGSEVSKKGEQKGEPFSLEKMQFRANKRANCGRTAGELKATNEEGKNERKEIYTKSDFHIRINKLFKRRESTSWDSAEIKAWNLNKTVIEGTSEDEWLTLERFYLRPVIEETYRRKSPASLMNHWNEEILKAKNYETKANGIHYEQNPRIIN